MLKLEQQQEISPLIDHWYLVKKRARNSPGLARANILQAPSPGLRFFVPNPEPGFEIYILEQASLMHSIQKGRGRLVANDGGSDETALKNCLHKETAEKNSLQ